MTDALSAGAAFAAGLAGTAHCAVMCGGIATAVGATFRHGQRAPLGAALAFNGARLVGYALVGALLSLFANLLLPAIPAAALGMRILVVVVLVALGLRLLTGRDLLGVERAGATFWRTLRPVHGRMGRLSPAWRPVGLGLLWGFMPCGLVYSVLLLAAAGGDALSGATTMLAFGAGTLPGVVAMTLGGATLGRALARPGLRHLAGVLVLGAAAWTATGVVLHGGGGHDHAHMHHALPG